MQFKAVIFDRDGVIVDSEPLNLSSALAAFTKQGIEISQDEKKKIIGTHPVDYQDYFKEKYSDFDFPSYRSYKEELYLQGLQTAPLFEQTIEFIKQLNQDKISLALVTSASQNGTKKILQRTGLTDIFKTVVTFEDCDQRKPAPDCYLLAAEKLSVEPNKCLVFEDSSVGLQAAKNAGMTCYVLPNKTTETQDFSKADKIIKDKSQLSKQLIIE